MQGKTKQYSSCGDDCICLDPESVKFGEGPACLGECGKPNWKGDGNCDKKNNNCGCGYDGGDCCGDSGLETQYNYCGGSEEVCCLDPKYKQDSPQCNGECGKNSNKGNGKCNDGNNNCGCDWDGGDCCGEGMEDTCKDPDYGKDQFSCEGTCTQKTLGNNKCNDANNICACDWDGGDCCGEDKEDTCKDPNA